MTMRCLTIISALGKSRDDLEAPQEPLALYNIYVYRVSNNWVKNTSYCL